MSGTPTITTLRFKSTAIHLQFVLQYFRHLQALRKGPYIRYSSHWHCSAPPICIAICLPFISQCFWENLGGWGLWDAPQSEHQDSHNQTAHLSLCLWGADGVAPGHKAEEVPCERGKSSTESPQGLKEAFEIPRPKVVSTDIFHLGSIYSNCSYRISTRGAMFGLELQLLVSRYFATCNYSCKQLFLFGNIFRMAATNGNILELFL